MIILGAIFAGGAARRFGGDKAAADVDGRALLDRVAACLAPQCDRLVIVGRDWPGYSTVTDRPAPGLGPLGALAGALAYGKEQGIDAVLTSGCDLPGLPADLRALLHPGPAVIAGQPLLGLWPADLADPLLAYLGRGGDRSMHAWIAASGARQVTPPRPIANINTRDDLARYLLTQPGGPRSSR